MVNPTNNYIISVKFDTDVWYRDEIAYNLKTTGRFFYAMLNLSFISRKSGHITAWRRELKRQVYVAQYNLLMSRQQERVIRCCVAVCRAAPLPARYSSVRWRTESRSRTSLHWSYADISHEVWNKQRNKSKFCQSGE